MGLTMLIAHITDTHITAPGTLLMGIVDTAAALARAVAAISELEPAPDVTVLTGDLVETGAPEEYAQLRALLAPLRMPVFVIPGNHDAREPMRQAFIGDGYLPQQGFLNYVVENYPLRIVALDTLVPGEGGGALCADRLHWVERILSAAPDLPTLILMHHPPFSTGIRRMDQAGLHGINGLAEIVRRRPQVERILCGHLHRPIEARFAGTVAGTAPSTAHQIVLDLRPESRLSFVLEPPGYQLHYWREGIGLVTHTAAIGDWQGPYFYSKLPAAS
jgi:3',5'-cyclic AMP phosphodiesterase CpdA